ncbi:MAG: putative DNA-binding domain [Solirubrobacteraceae bacterium]|jgi:hypothetical protein|nr:putative DNA-binding domain [Solirubrobacteraceae bacterium]
MARATEAQRRQAALERRRSAALQRARGARRASSRVAFRRGFDASSAADWRELVHDVVALANSGGGVVVVGVSEGGGPVDADLTAMRALEPARLGDRILDDTGVRLAGLEVVEVERDGAPAVAIVVDAAEVPLVFAQHAQAATPGALVVRHGARSEPATSADLARIVARRRREDRAALVRDVRRVVEGPADAEVALVRRAAPGELGPTATIQITTDPGAPVYGRLSPDLTHPHRQKEVIAEVNRRLGAERVNAFAIQSIRAVHALDEATVPELVHLPKFGSRQYSDAFVTWIVRHIEADAGFLDDTRARYLERRR